MFDNCFIGSKKHLIKVLKYRHKLNLISRQMQMDTVCCFLKENSFFLEKNPRKMEKGLS